MPKLKAISHGILSCEETRALIKVCQANVSVPQALRLKAVHLPNRSLAHTMSRLKHLLQQTKLVEHNIDPIGSHISSDSTKFEMHRAHFAKIIKKEPLDTDDATTIAALEVLLTNTDITAKAVNNFVATDETTVIQGCKKLRTFIASTRKTLRELLKGEPPNVAT